MKYLVRELPIPAPFSLSCRTFCVGVGWMPLASDNDWQLRPVPWEQCEKQRDKNSQPGGSKMVVEQVDVHSPLPRIKLELQLKYRASKLNNQLKTSWREVLQPRIYGRSHSETSRKGRDTQRAGPALTGGSWDSGRIPGLSSPEHQSWKEASA